MSEFIVYKVKLNKRKTKLIKTTDPFFKKRGNRKGESREFDKHKQVYRWYDLPINGTREELEKAFKVAEEYLYKLLHYAEKDEPIPKEELEESKRIFAFARQGPKSAYHILDKTSKLVSADVLYILTSTLPAKEISRIFNIEENEVRIMRRGENSTWSWEYRFVKRIRGAIKGQMNRQDYRKRIYSLSKMHSPTNKEILIYLTAYRKAKELRESLIPKLEMKKLLKEGTLDIIYPIERIELLQ